MSYIITVSTRKGKQKRIEISIPMKKKEAKKFLKITKESLKNMGANAPFKNPRIKFIQ